MNISFFRDAWLELKKLHAPSRQETIQATLVVLFMISVFAVSLGIIDMIVGKVMKGLMG